MKTDSTSAAAPAPSAAAPTKYSLDKKPFAWLKNIFDVPLVAEFYESPDVPQIIDSKTKLKCASIGIYTLTALAFALLVYQGLTTVQTVSVTVIVPLPLGSEDGFVCKSLGRYTGTPYQCVWYNSARAAIVDSICNPPSSPMNCADGKVNCTTTGYMFYGSVNGWKINMNNVYFATYADCLDKMGFILNDSIAAPYYTYEGTDKVMVSWPPYKGSIEIGDNSAEFQVASIAYLRTSWMSFLVPQTNTFDTDPFCGTDKTNYNADGTVIANSSIDIFVKNLPSHMLSDSYTTNASYCLRPTAENICHPFQTIGPYSCTKTTEITQPVLQVLGSSLSNVATLMAVLSMSLAWIVKKTDKKPLSDKSKPDEKVAPSTEVTTDPITLTS